MEQRQAKETDKQFVLMINRMAEEVKAEADLIGDDVTIQFTGKVKRVSTSIDEIKKEERQLKLGIIGSVKAGKSSFLNALIFDGDEILPKAPTPMTASLTKIKYAQVPEAKIVFYKKYDWENIKSMAQKYDNKVTEAYDKAMKDYQTSMAYCEGAPSIPYPNRETIEKTVRGSLSEEIVASKELVSMVEKRNMDPDKYLGTDVVIEGDPQEAPEAYINKLRQYVGSDGRFTPLVNHIELSINNPMLDGFEIIDTPGLNDPIISRSKATKEYLTNCDVVFLVSSVGQFLTRQDISLISKHLGQESIAHAYIIGSKLDSGILQYDRAERSVENAYNGSLDAYEAQAEKELNTLSIGNSSPLIKQLKETLPPIFVSSMIFGIAKKLESGREFNPEEAHVIHNFKSRFDDFDEKVACPSDFYDLANIQGVKDRAYSEVRKSKEQIIAKRVDSYTATQATDLIQRLESINITAKTNLENLRSGDIERLETKLTSLNHKLDSIRYEIHSIFENQAAKCRRSIEAIKVEISKEATHHTDITIETTEETVSRKEHYGLFGIMQRESQYLVKHKIASAHEAVENVRSYGTEAQKLINKNLQSSVDIEGLKDQVKKCVIGAFNLADKEFRPEEILLPLETMLERITIDSVRFDFIKEAEDAIYGAFASEGGVVSGNAIHQLYQLQEQQISRVLTLCASRLDNLEDNIVANMHEQAGVFVDGIIQRISSNIELTKKLLADREKNIKRYEKFLSLVSTYKEELIAFQR